MDLRELSYSELEALIGELEMEDETLRKDVDVLVQGIDKEESLDFIDDSEDETGDVSDVATKLNAINDITINATLRKKASFERQSKYRIRMQRLAVNQGLIKLSDTIPNYDLQALTKVLTEKQQSIANRASESANARLKRLLTSLIPIPVRRMYVMYPWVMRRCPGFTYTCIYRSQNPRSAVAAGQEMTFWATPNIPYYFKQGTEIDVLQAYRGELLYLVDNAVVMYFKYQNIQETKAFSIASRIIRNRVQTYFDLLMYNPRWFEILYNLAKNGETNSTQTSGTI